MLFVSLAILFPDLPLRWDALWYHSGAASLARGEGYVWRTEQECYGAREHYAFMPVGYPLFLSGIYLFTGPNPRAAYIANAVLVAMGVVLTCVVGRRLAGEGTARAGALFFAVMALTTKMGRDAYSEPLFIVMALTVAWAVLSPPSRGWYWVAGMALGLSALVRPVSVLMPALLLVAMLLNGRSLARSAGYAGAILAISLVVVAPWSVRNWYRFGRFVLVSTNGGSNLWIGHNPKTNGGHLDPEKGQLPIPPDLASTKGEAEWDRIAGRHAADYILSHPGSVLLRMPAKLSHTLGFGYAFRVWQGGEGGVKVAGVLVNAVAASVWLAATFVQGLWAVRRMGRDRSPATRRALIAPLFVAYFLMFPLVFFGVRRFLYPAYPFMGLSMAVLGAWAIDWARQRHAGGAGAALRPAPCPLAGMEVDPR